MKKIIISLFFISAVIACKENTTKNEKLKSISDLNKDQTHTTAEKIAHANGFEKWNDINTVNFTFNVTRNDKPAGTRSWSWKPKSNEVTIMTAKDTVSFNRNNLDEASKQYDAAFINDKYWLLAPYNLVWDDGTSFKEKEKAVAPISKDTLNMLTITYGNEGGYTPGDAYDLYYDKDFMVREWVFRQGDTIAPSMTTTWEDYEDFNGLKIAKMHKDETENFKLFFTDISVE
ncbi:hypothetical protein ULMS_26210 [Patiriisocius marinistellae]|uniref:Uncharacterized protein n=1 Tax=Patiriisocius marinistellae TaxID=2494560 RepID=A0A5J4FYJ0_9FLAO|nr:hypothetical protein [Patiriisocius marinistellae]GEQ87113.1 hypothetical protein ULMS_26210 [Patiriisocius marinistellae]